MGFTGIFILEHEDKISDINRMGFMTSTLNRMNNKTVKKHKENAEMFKNNLNL